MHINPTNQDWLTIQFDSWWKPGSFCFNACFIYPSTGLACLGSIASCEAGRWSVAVLLLDFMRSWRFATVEPRSMRRKCGAPGQSGCILLEKPCKNCKNLRFQLVQPQDLIPGATSTLSREIFSPGKCQQQHQCMSRSRTLGKGYGPSSLRRALETPNAKCQMTTDQYVCRKTHVLICMWNKDISQLHMLCLYYVYY